MQWRLVAAAAMGLLWMSSTFATAGSSEPAVSDADEFGPSSESLVADDDETRIDRASSLGDSSSVTALLVPSGDQDEGGAGIDAGAAEDGGESD